MDRDFVKQNQAIQTVPDMLLKGFNNLAGKLTSQGFSGAPDSFG